MSKITTLGIDLAKSIFQPGVDAEGKRYQIYLFP